jgi:pimeloyl-ACP methyl ester carboxylesterase
MTTTCTSRDGTRIAYESTGSGDALVLVDGALCHRASGPNRALAAALADRFTVYTYDRRGRGESGDTAPYAVEREIEDLEAVIEAAGSSAHVYGISSGGVLALEAALRLPQVRRLALYEPPFVVDDTRKPIPAGFAVRLEQLAATGRRAEAVRYFMSDGVGVPAIFVALMRLMPAWSRLKAVAHTLSYDAALLGPETGDGTPLPVERWAGLDVPTVVIGGGKSPQWMRNAVASLAGTIGAEHRVLEGQTHLVKPQALAPVLADFYAEVTMSRA